MVNCTDQTNKLLKKPLKFKERGKFTLMSQPSIRYSLVWTMIAAQWTPVSALKDWVPMQDICYNLHFDLKKNYFLLAF